MKKLTCEMCGSTDLLKSDGVFVCQSCGTKYSVEEAKKMMVEGTVQVEGTVKIDNTSNIDNLIKNAKVLYKDGKNNEAYKLFGDVLNIDTENYIALVYRGLCSAWNTTVGNPQIDDAVKGVARGLEIAKKKLGETREYAEFCMEISEAMFSISVACMNLFEKHYKNAYDNYMNYFEKSKGKINMYNVDYYKESSEREKIRWEKAESTAINGMYLTLVASNVVMVKVATVKDETIYNAEDYSKLKEYVKKYMAVPSQYINKELDDYKIGLGFMLSFDKKIKNLEKKEREEYFKEHPEEKDKLLEEIKEAKEHNKECLKIIETSKSSIKQIEDEIEDSVKPLLSDIKSLDKKIERLNDEKSSLGLFKLKERKNIQTQIDELEEEKEKKEKKCLAEKEKVRKIKKDEIEKIEEKIEKAKKDIKKNNNKIEKATIKLEGSYEHKDDTVYEDDDEDIKCSNCGAKVKETDTKCPKCGINFEEEDNDDDDDLKDVLGID